MKRKPSAAMLLMPIHLKELFTGCVLLAEYPFCPGRKFRADFCLPHRKILIEIEGGHWTGGRHNTGSGFVNDMEKYNLAQLMGFKVFRFLPAQVLDGTAKEFMRKVLESKGGTA